MTNDSTVNCDVVIVGAGLAGLTAARELQKSAPDLKVVVLEAKNRVGGRTLTLNLRTESGTDQWDLGGQWIGTTQLHILQLMKELQVEQYPQHIQGTKLAQIGGVKIRPFSNYTIPTWNDVKEYSIWEGIDFIRSLTKLEKMIKQLDANDIFAHTEAGKWDQMSVADWARQNCSTRTAADSLELSARAAYGIQGKRLSLLYFLYYAKCAGSLDDLFETAGSGAQGHRIKGGSQALSRIMAEDLGQAAVLLETAVTEIEQVSEDRVCIRTVSTQSSKEHRNFICKRVILAMPPSECGHIRFSPALPFLKRQLFDGAPMGNLLKFVVTYKKPFWRDMGFSGELLSTGYTEQPGEILPICAVFDATTNYGNAALVGFIQNEYWTERPMEERRDAVLQDLTRFLGPECLKYIDYEDKDWCKEPYSGGCPVACVGTGNMEYLMHIREPVNLIHFAGTETATIWPGYMSGAVQSGIRVAHEMLWHFRPELVKEENLEGSIYAKTYHPPSRPTDQTYIRPFNPWLRRVVVVATLAVAVYACSKKYRLNYFERMFRPIESRAMRWLYERYNAV